MNINKSIQTLKSMKAGINPKYRAYADEVIGLFKDRKIEKTKEAEALLIKLGSRGKAPQSAITAITEKHRKAEPATGKLTRPQEQTFFVKGVIRSSIVYEQRLKKTGAIKEREYENPDEIYVQKIEILDVHVNREIYQPQQYRYLGAERNYNVKKDENYIKYYKAWNASFEYKGFNLDMNNDIAYECVPSALYNTYGIKKENSYDYLHSIHKGGLNYVKSCLNKNDKYVY